MTDIHEANDRSPRLESDPDRVQLILALAKRNDTAELSEHRDDPELLRAVERQRRVALMLQAGGPTTPQTLRNAADRSERRSRRLSWARPGPRSARAGWPRLSAGLAAAAIAVVVGLSVSSSGGALAATRVADLWTRPATSSAVNADPSDAADLDVLFHGTQYPNYHDSEGWHPVGTRTDRVAGRAEFTVYYATGSRRAAYTVVAGAGVSVPKGGRRFVAGGRRLIEFRDGDRWVIVFRDHGNSCVLTAAAPREERWLVKLAVWHGTPAPGGSV